MPGRADQRGLGQRQPGQVQRAPGPAGQQRGGRRGEQAVWCPGDDRERRVEQQEPGGGAGLRGAAQLRAVLAGSGPRARPRCAAGRGTPSSIAIRAMSATYPSRPAWSSGRAPNRLCARRKLSASAMCTQVSNCGSDAAYGRPSGAMPVTLWWMASTRLTVSCASLAVRTWSRPGSSWSAAAGPRITLEAGMRGHRGHGERVQRLQQQRADAADEHGRVAVHPPDRPVRGEPPLAASLVDHSPAGGP